MGTRGSFPRDKAARV